MSFLKNLGKSKVKFDFFIKVCYLTNLPNAMEGTSALIQVSRKEKECSTKYSLVTNQTVAWDEVVALSSTFFTEKSPDDSLVPFSSKTYTIKVKGLGNNAEKWKAELDMSQFLRMGVMTETEHIIEYTNTGHASVPMLKLVIRSYCEGVDSTDVSEFKSSATTSPSKFTALSVPSDPQTSYMGIASPRRAPGTIDEEEEDDVDFTENPAHEHTVSGDRRKISMIFNSAAGNGGAPAPTTTTPTTSPARPGGHGRAPTHVRVQSHTADALKEFQHGHAPSKGSTRMSMSRHVPGCGSTATCIAEDDELAGAGHHRDRLISMDIQYDKRVYSAHDADELDDLLNE